MMNHFTEDTLEKAVLKLFEAERITHCQGDTIHKEMADVLLRDDLKQFLLNQYASDNITLNEIISIIRQLELYPNTALYDSNKAIMKLVADGFPINDRTL
jgi:type I restriction enzyme, R subunit